MFLGCQLASSIILYGLITLVFCMCVCVAVFMCVGVGQSSQTLPAADKNETMSLELRPIQRAGATLASVGRDVQGTFSMAPQYAPSQRSRLPPLLLFLQIGLIVIYAFYTETESHLKVDGITFRNFYPGT